jgi:arsenate reductase
MAEGWARTLRGEKIEAYSAGIEPKGLDPRAVRVMAEAGVDISGQRCKHVDEMKDMDFDCVVTVCDQAHQQCPYFPGKVKIVHVGFDDPLRLASKARNKGEVLGYYRRVRDEIKSFVEKLPAMLSQTNKET